MDNASNSRSRQWIMLVTLGVDNIMLVTLGVDNVLC